MVHLFSCLFFMILFYGLCMFAMLCDGGHDRIRRIHRSFSAGDRLFIGVTLAAAIAFVVFWIKQDRFVYYWDYAGYWSASINRMRYMFDHSFLDIVKTLRESIQYDDYNIFLPTIVALPLKLFGYTFQKYVLVNCLMFLFPTYFVWGMLAGKLVNHSSIKENRLFICAFLMAVCFPGNYYAAFRGFIDVAFLLPMSIAMYLFVDYDFRRIAVTRNISIALMLILILLSRRYTFYFVIGYVVALILRAICCIVHDGLVKNIRAIMLSFLMIGVVSLGTLMIFFRQFILHALLTDYGFMYSAYDVPLSDKIHSLMQAFGGILGIIILVVGFLCLHEKRNCAIYVELFLMGLVEAVLFWQTQRVDSHHKMMLNLPVFMIFFMLFDFWNNEMKRQIKSQRIRKGIILICVFLYFINFGKSYIPVFSQRWTNAFFSEKYQPLQRGDIGALKNLAERLNELTIGTDDYIYVLASGKILNCDILRKLEMPNSDNAVEHVLTTCDVDLRDGFPTEFLSAKYVVTTDPVELHLKTGQEVVNYLAKYLQDDNSYLGRHFQYMEQIELDDGVRAKLYVKTSEFSDNDLDKMRAYFSDLYPGCEALFTERIR